MIEEKREGEKIRGKEKWRQRWVERGREKKGRLDKQRREGKEDKDERGRERWRGLEEVEMEDQRERKGKRENAEKENQGREYCLWYLSPFH